MKLSDLATVIRSKNAGPFEPTFDVPLANRDTPSVLFVQRFCRWRHLQTYFVFQSAT